MKVNTVMVTSVNWVVICMCLTRCLCVFEVKYMSFFSFSMNMISSITPQTFDPLALSEMRLCFFIYFVLCWPVLKTIDTEFCYRPSRRDEPHICWYVKGLFQFITAGTFKKNSAVQAPIPCKHSSIFTNSLWFNFFFFFFFFALDWHLAIQCDVWAGWGCLVNSSFRG